MQNTYSNEVMVEPSPDLVRRHLERILMSPQFDKCQRTCDFLSYVVSKALDGHMDEISQEALAEEVFGRQNGFDATTDPIVRMHAGRVRRSLEHYYLTDGIRDTVRIEIPKGTYVPHFAHRANIENLVVGTQPGKSEVLEEMSLSLRPLRNLTNSDEIENIALELISELGTELSRYKDVSVYLAPEEMSDRVDLSSARYELSGFITSHNDHFKVNLHLTKGPSHQQIWARSSELLSFDSSLAVSLSELTQSTAAVLAEEQGILYQHMWAELDHQPEQTGGILNATLLHHRFEVTRTAVTLKESLDALEEAVKDASVRSLYWAYLARLKATDWSLQISAQPAPIEDALEAARQAIALDPSDLRLRLTQAHIRLLNDQIHEAVLQADRVLKSSKDSIFWLDIIGVLLTLGEDWERGPELIRKAFRLNPYARNIGYIGLWLDAVHRNDSRAVIEYAAHYASPGNFWSPLMRAVGHVRLKQINIARSEVSELLSLKPDFKEQGRWLIGRYVKSKDLVDQIGRDLAVAGVELD